MLVAVLLAGGVVLAVRTLDGTDTATGGGPGGASAAATGGPVTYEVGGTGSATAVSFSVGEASGDSEVLAPPLPFRTTVAPAPPPAVFTVVVRGVPGSGPLSCTVSQDGRVLDQRSSNDGTVVCSAS